MVITIDIYGYTCSEINAWHGIIELILIVYIKNVIDGQITCEILLPKLETIANCTICQKIRVKGLPVLSRF